MPDELAEEKPAGSEETAPEPEKPARRPRRKRSLKIDPDAVVNSVLKRLDQAISDRSEWMNMRLDRYAKLRGWLPDKDWPWDGAANTWVPIMATASLRVKSALFNAVMGLRPVMMSRAHQRRNAAKQERIDQLLDWQVFTEAKGEQKFDDFISNFVDDGTAFAFVRWVRDRQTIHDVRVMPGLDETQDHIPQVLERMPALFPGFRNATMPKDDDSGWVWEVDFQDEAGEERVARVEFFDRDDGRLEAHLSWKATVHDGPAIDVDDPEDVVFPMRAANLQPPSGANPRGAPWVDRLCVASLDDIRRRKEDGIYDLLTDEGLEAIAASQSPVGSGKDEERAKEQKDDQEGIQSAFGEEDKTTRSIVEAYDRWDVDGDGLEEDVIFWIARDAQKLLRARLLTEMHPGLPIQRPIASKAFIPVSNRVYGIGLPELLESIQDLSTIVMNQNVDWGTLRNSPFFFYRPTSGVKPEVIRMWPGEGYPLDDPSRDIQFPNWGNTDNAWSFNMLAFAQQLAERITMISDVQLGRVPTGKASALRTLGTTISLLGQGDVRSEQILRRLFHGLAQVYAMIHRLNRRYLPAKKEFRVIGVPAKGEEAYAEVTPDDVDADVDFEFRATMLNTNRQILAETMTEIAGMMLTPLAIQMGYTDSETGYNVLRDFVKARDQDPEKYIKRPPALPEGPRILAEEALSAILEGTMPMGAPLEPVQEHLKKLLDFQQSENFGLLDQAGVQLFSAYLRQVMVLAQQDVQQQQLLQAAAQFQGQGGGNGGGPGGVLSRIGPPEQSTAPLEANELRDESVGMGG